MLHRIGLRADLPSGGTPRGRATVAALVLAKKEHVVRQRPLCMLRAYRDIVRKYDGDPTHTAREFRTAARGHIDSTAHPEAPSARWRMRSPPSVGSTGRTSSRS